MSIEEINASAVINAMAERVMQVNTDNGWFQDGRTFGEDVALLHSEVSEMLEAYREWGIADMTAGEAVGFINGQIIPKPEGIGSEMADVLIRLLDTSYRYNIDLYAEFNRKLNYNTTRAHRHGGKKL